MNRDRRVDQVDRLLSTQRAAQAMTDSASVWWRNVSEAADSTMTDESLDSFNRLLLEAIQPVLEADEVSILITDPEETALVTRTSLGLGERGTVALWIPSGEGMAGQVLASKEPLIIEDLSSISLVSPTLEDRGLRSVVAVPILSGSSVLGVMHAGSTELAHFGNEDAQLLEILAERVALAIERIRLLQEQRRLASMSTFLADTARIMAGALDLTATLDELAKAALPAIGDLCLIDILEENRICRMTARHRDPGRQPLADRLREEFGPALHGNHPAAHALRMGGTRWAATMSDEFLRATTVNEEHFRLTKALEFRSFVAVPIGTEGAVGALTLVSCTRSFTPADVTMVEVLAQQVGSIVAKAKHLEEASLTSRQLQAVLLPDIPDSLPGLRIHASYAAASEALDVGGDFYDVVDTPGARTWIVIGDMEGHDRRAAAEMGQLRSAIRTLIARGLRPEEIINELRGDWSILGLSRTATVLLGWVDTVSGRLVLASAGHPPPLLVTTSDAYFLPIIPNPLLGRRSSKQAEAYETSMAQGDVIMLYTDGALRERSKHVDDAMAEIRMISLGTNRDPRKLCEQIIGSVGDSDDDTALLATKWNR